MNVFDDDDDVIVLRTKNATFNVGLGAWRGSLTCECNPQHPGNHSLKSA